MTKIAIVMTGNTPDATDEHHVDEPDHLEAIAAAVDWLCEEGEYAATKQDIDMSDGQLARL